jgi:predicted small lipoprotein YifL
MTLSGRAAALAASAALVLAGCGQKGPLYLPEKKGGAVVTAPEGPPPAPTTPGQPSAVSPAPEPQSSPGPPPAPATSPPPPKKSDTDEDQNPK